MIKKLKEYQKPLRLILKYGFKDELKQKEFATQIGSDESVPPSDDAKSLVKDLQEMGPTYVKIGQLLSTRPDLMPLKWREELKTLQDDVDPIPFEVVKEVIEREFGTSISRLFGEFNETPLASASLGQVHLATLRDDDRKLAVKIQRPGIRAKITEELEAISRLAELFENHTETGKRYEISRVVQQFRRSLIQELDYELEMENLLVMRENLKGKRAIRVPKPIEDYCTSKVLTMEYLSGQKITEVSGVVFTEVDGAHLADELFSAYLKQVLVDGFFHADPHPGNLLLTEDHHIALLDLGMVGSVPNRLKDHLLQLLSAVAEGRSSDVAQVANKIGVPKEHFRRDKFDEAIVRIIEDRRGSSIKNADVGGLIMDVTQAAAVHGLRIPDSLYMLGKMLLNLDAVGIALDKDFDAEASIRRHLADLSQHRLMDEFKLSNLIPDVVELKELIRQTPARLNLLSEKIAENQLRIKIDAIDEDKLMIGFHRVANRITVGLILAAMIVGGAMLMNIESRFTLLGYPGLAILVFLGAAIGGTILIVNILRSK